MTIGEKIVWWRKRHRAPAMTQDALARRVGVSRIAVVQWEGGKSEPTHKHLEMVAQRGFGVSVSKFHAEPERRAAQ